MKEVMVLPHDQRWAEAFAQEAEDVRLALGDSVNAIHHIGSAAVPGIYAKPVIDILVEVSNIDDVGQRSAEMRAIGYEVMGEFGISGRRYFRKDNEHGTRTHQVHVFAAGSDQIERHLAFRDHLIAQPAVAKEYSDLKRKLAAEHPSDMDAYMDGKDPFIKTIDAMLMTAKQKLNGQYLLVYGMLRRGGGHSMAANAPGSRFIADAEVPGKLYDMGDYPALVPGSSGSVQGEVWTVSEDVLAQLDKFEATAGYTRSKVEVLFNERAESCWVYTPDPDRCRAAKLIDSGDWISYSNNKKMS